MPAPPPRVSQLSVLWPGFLAGVVAGLLMLLTMAALRLFFGWATPTELIFDRLFPKLSIDFFIWSLVQAGGYTPLKLTGVFGALTGQLAVAGLGGIIYSAFLARTRQRHNADPANRGWTDPRGWRLVIPGVLAVWLLFLIFLRPNLLTHYHGLPPARATVVTALELLISFAVCGWTIMLLHAFLTLQPQPLEERAEDVPVGQTTGRRAFLAGAVGAGLALVLGGVLRRLFKIGTFAYDGREYLGPKVQKITPIAPEDEFYQVSKNLVDPAVVRDAWRLDIVGQVENPRVYSFAELAALPAVEQETTLLCISYRVGGGLCSNALWKGVPLRTLLEEARPKRNVAVVLFRASDGYYETFPFAKAMEPTTLLAYGMNGQPLPQRHGFPLRMVVPGLYGEKNPKWLTRIELLDESDARLHQRHGCGFYKEQGWGPNFTIPTTSRFDAPQVSGDHFEKPFKAGSAVELRGMAFGGDRGVTKVELSFDGGKTWHEVPITQPGTKISWSLWAYQWTPAAAGDAQLVVRATDGDGKLQISEDRSSVPQGATGLHRVRAKVEAA